MKLLYLIIYIKHYLKSSYIKYQKSHVGEYEVVECGTFLELLFI